MAPCLDRAPIPYGFIKRVNQLWTRRDSAVVEADAKRQIEVYAEQHPLLATNQWMRGWFGVSPHRISTSTTATR